MEDAPVDRGLGAPADSDQVATGSLRLLLRAPRHWQDLSWCPCSVVPKPDTWGLARQSGGGSRRRVPARARSTPVRGGAELRPKSFEHQGASHWQPPHEPEQLGQLRNRQVP
jgi:hypothetical protein